MPTPRCNQSDCKKKLMLSDMPCRCSKRFCLKHRLPETHECGFDHKNVKPIKLEGCVKEKVEKI